MDAGAAGALTVYDPGMDPNETKDAPAEDELLREEDVTLQDALDDRVPEGDGLADGD